MALVLHLGGVGECVRLIWEWSVHNQESGDLHTTHKLEIPKGCARYPQASILGIWNSHIEPVSLTLAKLACAF